MLLQTIALAVIHAINNTQQSSEIISPKLTIYYIQPQVWEKFD